MAREALTNARGLERYAAASCVIAVALSLAPLMALAARHARHAPADLPLAPSHIPSSTGRSRSAAANMRRWHGPISPAGARTIICRPTRRFAPAASRSRRSTTPPADPKALGSSLRDPCRAAKAADITDGAKARAFFEENFLPLRISRLGEDEGFVTGYYEPVDRRIADPDRRLHRAGLSPSFQPVRPRLQAKLSRLAQQGPGVSQDRPPQAGALLRSRRDRRRRDRRPRPRNLLAQEPDRSAVHANPGLGAGPPRGRLDHPHQLRCA